MTGVGDRLRRCRAAAGISSGDLAKRTGLAPDHVEAVERGVERPPLGEVLDLAAALDVEPDVRLGGEEPKPSAR